MTLPATRDIQHFAPIATSAYDHRTHKRNVPYGGYWFKVDIIRSLDGKKVQFFFLDWPDPLHIQLNCSFVCFARVCQPINTCRKKPEIAKEITHQAYCILNGTNLYFAKLVRTAIFHAGVPVCYISRCLCLYACLHACRHVQNPAHNIKISKRKRLRIELP